MGLTRAEIDARHELIAQLWKDGWTSTKIAEATGMTMMGVLMVVKRMRQAGRDLPVRSPKNAARFARINELDRQAAR